MEIQTMVSLQVDLWSKLVLEQPRGILPRRRSERVFGQLCQSWLLLSRQVWYHPQTQALQAWLHPWEIYRAHGLIGCTESPLKRAQSEGSCFRPCLLALSNKATSQACTHDLDLSLQILLAASYRSTFKSAIKVDMRDVNGVKLEVLQGCQGPEQCKWWSSKQWEQRSLWNQSQDAENSLWQPIWPCSGARSHQHCIWPSWTIWSQLHTSQGQFDDLPSPIDSMSLHFLFTSLLP